MSDASVAAASPVQAIPTDVAEPLDPRPALCLSGGGYRAMVFHVGALWRLYETGLLGGANGISRISSVSGGSITAAFLGMQWHRLDVDAPDVHGRFIPNFVTPMRAFAGKSIGDQAFFVGLLPGISASDRIAQLYDSYLFGGATLQDLPDAPRFVINASNVQSGVLWRFTKRYMWDYRVGKVERPTLPLARVVAASTAFPPVLSPCELQLDDSDFSPGTGTDLQRPPFTTKVVLTDGGVYDNMGLETAWKRHKTVLVSDAGGTLQPEAEPKQDWIQHTFRVLMMMNDQVRALRTRQVIDAFVRQATEPESAASRKGAYWGMRTDIANYRLADALPCPHDATLRLAEIATEMNRLEDLTQQRLINWGYAVCDAALRAHLDPGLTPPPQFPYPAAQV